MVEGIWCVRSGLLGTEICDGEKASECGGKEKGLI